MWKNCYDKIPWPRSLCKNSLTISWSGENLFPRWLANLKIYGVISLGDGHKENKFQFHNIILITWTVLTHLYVDGDVVVDVRAA